MSELAHETTPSIHRRYVSLFRNTLNIQWLYSSKTVHSRIRKRWVGSEVVSAKAAFRSQALTHSQSVTVSQLPAFVCALVGLFTVLSVVTNSTE